MLDEPPAREFREACYQATGGNPLLLRQLLTALAAEGVKPEAAQAQVVREIGPRAVSRTVMLRLARLSDDARAVAQSVAVLGDDSALHTVAALAGLDEPIAASATGELATAEILRHGTPLGFVHPLVRDAVYRELPPGERELQHDRAARMLNDAGAPPEQVAAHLLVTSPRGEEWVADLLQEAGRAAFRRGASDSAPTYLRRALREPAPAARTPQLILELGLAEIMTDGAAALEHLRTAYEGLRDPVAKAIAAGALGRGLMFINEAEAAAELAHRAAAEVPDEWEDLRKGLQAFEYCTYFFMDDQDPSVLAGIEQHRKPPAADAPVGDKMLAAIAAAHWSWTGGSAAEVSELASAAVAGGDLMRGGQRPAHDRGDSAARRGRPRGGGRGLGAVSRRGAQARLGLRARRPSPLVRVHAVLARGALGRRGQPAHGLRRAPGMGLRQDCRLVLRCLPGRNPHLARERRRRPGGAGAQSGAGQQPVGGRAGVASL